MVFFTKIHRSTGRPIDWTARASPYFISSPFRLGMKGNLQPHVIWRSSFPGETLECPEQKNTDGTRGFFRSKWFGYLTNRQQRKIDITRVKKWIEQTSVSEEIQILPVDESQRVTTGATRSFAIRLQINDAASFALHGGAARFQQLSGIPRRY